MSNSMIKNQRSGEGRLGGNCDNQVVFLVDPRVWAKIGSDFCNSSDNLNLPTFSSLVNRKP